MSSCSTSEPVISECAASVSSVERLFGQFLVAVSLGGEVRSVWAALPMGPEPRSVVPACSESELSAEGLVKLFSVATSLSGMVCLLWAALPMGSLALTAFVIILMVLDCVTP